MTGPLEYHIVLWNLPTIDYGSVYQWYQKTIQWNEYWLWLIDLVREMHSLTCTSLCCIELVRFIVYYYTPVHCTMCRLTNNNNAALFVQTVLLRLRATTVSLIWHLCVELTTYGLKSLFQKAFSQFEASFVKLSLIYMHLFTLKNCSAKSICLHALTLLFL